MGYIEVILSGLFFGTLPIFGTWLLGYGLSSGEVLALRFLTASLVSLVILFFWKRDKIWPKTSMLAVAALLGILGYAVFSFCFFQAMKDLSASAAVMLLYQYPWMVALGGAIFLGEKLSRKQAVFFPMMIVGLALVVGFDYEVKSLWGVLSGLGAAMFYSAYILIARKHFREIDPYVGVAWIQFFAGLSLFALNFSDPSRIPQIFSEAGHLVLGIAVIPTILAMSLFIAGLQKIRAWEVSMLSTLEPLTAVLLSYLVLGEQLTTHQVLGCLIVFLALVALGWTQSRANGN